MSNHNIAEILRGQKHFKGVFMRDEKLPKSGAFVLNLDTSQNQGTHWTCFYCGEYYDSFGLPPPEKLSHFVTWENTVQHQTVGSSACGYYVCMYILLRNAGVSAYDICYNFLKKI